MRPKTTIQLPTLAGETLQFGEAIDLRIWTRKAFLSRLVAVSRDSELERERKTARDLGEEEVGRGRLSDVEQGLENVRLLLRRRRTSGLRHSCKESFSAS